MDLRPKLHQDSPACVSWAYFNDHPGDARNHKFLTAGVNLVKSYIFETLTLRAINWCINELILRGSGGESKQIQGGAQFFSGVLQQKFDYIVGFLSSSPVYLSLCWESYWRGGPACMATSWHGMPLSRPQGCIQENNLKHPPNLQVSCCIMYNTHEWSKRMQRSR